MRKHLAKLAALAAIGLAPALTAWAQAPKGAVNDSLFAMAAAGGGMAEVAISKLALQRAGDAETKKFAQRMIDDHTKANQELMALAAAKRLAVPRELSPQDQAAYDALNGLQGADFDGEYARQQLAAHICTVQLFQAEAERGQDPDIKAFAAKTLPHLKEHLHMVRGMARHEGSEKSRKAEH